MCTNNKSTIKSILFVHFIGAALSFFSAQSALAEETHPVVTFENYLSALEAGEGDVVLGYVTNKSRAMMKNHKATAGQMALEAATLKECGEPFLRARGERAVLYFDMTNKKCSPYFMSYEDNAWKFDLYTMSQAIRYDQKNHWKLNKNVKHPYLYAFGIKE
jgi:hypothetical protein